MNLMELLIVIVVWGVVLYICWWAIGKIGLPEPFNKIAVVVLVLLSVVVAFNILGRVVPGIKFW